MLVYIVLLVYICQGTDSILCYNCTFSHREFGLDPIWNRGLFSSRRSASRIRCAVTVKCPEGAMCFVRSWSERARHSWLVQRGCYTPEENDPLPAAMNLPARSMTCRRERFAEAEYKVCLCQADWCNTSSRITVLLHHARTLVFFILLLIVFT